MGSMFNLDCMEKKKKSSWIGFGSMGLSCDA